MPPAAANGGAAANGSAAADGGADDSSHADGTGNGADANSTAGVARVIGTTGVAFAGNVPTNTSGRAAGLGGGVVVVESSGATFELRRRRPRLAIPPFGTCCFAGDGDGAKLTLPIDSRVLFRVGCCSGVAASKGVWAGAAASSALFSCVCGGAGLGCLAGTRSNAAMVSFAPASLA